MTEKKSRIAIIGCGNIGTYHLDHFLKMDDVQVVGVCDLRASRANAFSKKASCPAFEDFREMYDEVRPDMVFICVPPYCHGDIEMETIRRGIPMFVEKPVGLDVDQILTIRDAVKKAGLITASGLQLRYESNIPVLKRFAKEHRIVQTNLTRIESIPNTPWWKIRRLSGGQLVEQTIHQVDMMRNVMQQDPVEIFALGSHDIVKGIDAFDVEDLSSAVIRFANGAIGTITTGCYATSGAAADSKLTFGALDARADYYMFDKVAIYGETAKASASTEGKDEVVSGDGRLDHSAAAAFYRPEGDCGMLCDHTFIEAVQTGDPSKIKSPYEDAVKTVLFTLAYNKALDTGKPVDVNINL